MNSQLGKLAQVRAYDVTAGNKVVSEGAGHRARRFYALRFEKKCVCT